MVKFYIDDKSLIIVSIEIIDTSDIVSLNQVLMCHQYRAIVTNNQW